MLHHLAKKDVYDFLSIFNSNCIMIYNRLLNALSEENIYNCVHFVTCWFYLKGEEQTTTKETDSFDSVELNYFQFYIFCILRRLLDSFFPIDAVVVNYIAVRQRKFPRKLKQMPSSRDSFVYFAQRNVLHQQGPSE